MKRRSRQQIEVRRASLKDLNSIVELDMNLADFHAKVDSDHKTGKESKAYFKKLYRKMLRRKDSLVLLAIKSGKPIGFLSGGMIQPSPFSRQRKVAEVEAVNVLPKHRSQRLGSFLLKHFASWAAEKKATQLQACVHAANTKSVKFWKRQRFSEKTITLCLDMSK